MKHLLVIALFATTAPAAIRPTEKEMSVSALQENSFFPVITWGSPSTAYSDANNTVHYHISTSYESDVVKIQIERHHAIGGWKLVQELPAGTYNYNYYDSNVIPGDTYKYRARGVSSASDLTPYSPEVSITIPLP